MCSSPAQRAALKNMAELMGWYAAGKVKPVVQKTWPLAQAAEALEFIHARQATGKVVLKP